MFYPPRGLLIACGIAIVTSALATSCANDGATLEDPGVEAGAAGGDAGAGGTAGTTGGASGSGGSGGSIIDLPDSGGDGPVCASDVVDGEPLPLAILILLDRSGSMAGARWDSATKALRAFADTSGVVGSRMGLQVFPPVTGDQCSASAYQKLLVPMGPVPANTLTIAQKLESTDANGGATPMGAGLQGAISAMRTELAARPLQDGVVVLVTDGEPTSCSPSSASGIAELARNARNPQAGLPRVTTFVVGMTGAKFATLDEIALAGGGAPTAFDVSKGADSQQALLAALEAIRTSVLGCDFLVPDPGAGKQLDLESVSVDYVPPAPGVRRKIAKVKDLAACGTSGEGFYYDDPSRPTRATLCPASCEAVRSGPPQAKVEIVLGCIIDIT